MESLKIITGRPVKGLSTPSIFEAITKNVNKFACSTTKLNTLPLFAITERASSIVNAWASATNSIPKTDLHVSSFQEMTNLGASSLAVAMSNANKFSFPTRELNTSSLGTTAQFGSSLVGEWTNANKYSLPTTELYSLQLRASSLVEAWTNVNKYSLPKTELYTSPLGSSSLVEAWTNANKYPLPKTELYTSPLGASSLVVAWTNVNKYSLSKTDYMSSFQATTNIAATSLMETLSSANKYSFPNTALYKASFRTTEYRANSIYEAWQENDLFKESDNSFGLLVNTQSLKAESLMHSIKVSSKNSIKHEHHVSYEENGKVVNHYHYTVIVVQEINGDNNHIGNYYNNIN